MVKNALNVVKIKSGKYMFYIFVDILLKGMSYWNFPDLLESLYSFEISQNLATIKTGKNKVKSGCF